MSFKFNVFKPLLICSTNLLILIISWLLIAVTDAYIHVGKIEYMKRWIKTIKKHIKLLWPGKRKWLHSDFFLSLPRIIGL